MVPLPGLPGNRTLTPKQSGTAAEHDAPPDYLVKPIEPKVLLDKIAALG